MNNHSVLHSLAKELQEMTACESDVERRFTELIDRAEKAEAAMTDLLDENHRLETTSQELARQAIAQIREITTLRSQVASDSVAASQKAALEEWQRWWSKVMRPYVVQLVDQVHIWDNAFEEASRRDKLPPPVLNEFPVAINSDGKLHERAI